MVIKTLLDLVRELNALNDDNLAERVIKDGDVQWCLLELQDILEAGQSALRPASREQVEKAWRAKWIDAHQRTRSCKCTRCNSVQEFETDFCSSCGASMTDEAVEMVMERVEDMLSKE